MYRSAFAPFTSHGISPFFPRRYRHHDSYHATGCRTKQNVRGIFIRTPGRSQFSGFQFSGLPHSFHRRFPCGKTVAWTNPACACLPTSRRISAIS